MLLRTREGTATVVAPAATERPAGREAPQPVTDMPTAAHVTMAAQSKAAAVTVPEARALTRRDYTQSRTLQGPEPRRTL